MTTFHIIAYPDGARAVVGTLHARDIMDVEPQAAVHARLRGEYVDIEVDGRCRAVCDGAGAVPAFGVEDFRTH
jgi:hypothetical protein